jgi:hypothetical protein
MFFISLLKEKASSSFSCSMVNDVLGKVFVIVEGECRLNEELLLERVHMGKLMRRAYYWEKRHRRSHQIDGRYVGYCTIFPVADSLTAPKTGILALSLEAHDLHTHLFHVKKNR